ncbi:MAG: hypothetical protein ABI304_08735 [Rudaea sp.]
MDKRRTLLRYVLAFGLCTPWVLVRAATLEIVDIDPNGGTLRVGASLYIKARYISDKPVRIQTVGMRNGAIVPGLMNASPAYREGEGDVLTWVAFNGVAEIDTLRVTLFDSQWLPVASRDLPIQAAWSNDAPAPVVAQWVPSLRKQQQQLIDTQNKVAESKQSGVGGFVVGGLISFAIPAYLLLQLWLAIHWRGRWRISAMLPLFVMIPVWLFSFYALSRGSNLWPIWIVFISPLALAYLVLLWLVRRFAR